MNCYINDGSVEPIPLRREVEDTVHKLKEGKSPGLDNIPGELLKYSGESSIRALHQLCIQIWNTCQWPTDWKQQEFVMLHKSGDTKLWKLQNHRFD